MKYYIIGLTMIPFFFNYYSHLFDMYKRLDESNTKVTAWLTKNFFKEFRIDSLILILLFIYFASFDKAFVSKYLFLVINLYFYINSLYEKSDITSTIKCIKKNYKEMLVVNLISFIPIFYYIISKKHIVKVYISLFIIIFINFIIMYIVRLAKEKILSIKSSK